jgi:AcrR family transcriptional regulator
MTVILAPDHAGDASREPDGRRARSRSSRARIVSAMLELVGNGDVSPSAARVAEVAGVGLRSVFRHFDDMDALYREMCDAIEAKVIPIIMEVPIGDTWKDRLLHTADKRARVFEAILPYRISANLKRFQSEFLMQDYKRMLRLESESLDAQLPPSVRDDTLGARAINVILSFQTWRLLRHDQELPVADACAVVRRLLEDAMSRLPDR